MTEAREGKRGGDDGSGADGGGGDGDGLKRRAKDASRKRAANYAETDEQTGARRRAADGASHARTRDREELGRRARQNEDGSVARRAQKAEGKGARSAVGECAG